MKVEERTLSVREAAIVLSVDQETVKRWLRSGLFETAYKDKSNIWRIPKELVDKLPKTKKMDSRIIKANLKYVGEKYNELTILEITDYMKDGTNKKLAVVAGCECGNKVVKPLYQIINGIIKCCSNECVTKSGFKPGDRYGFLTILGDAGLRNYGEQRNNRWIKAICDCGTETEKPLKRLKSGEVNSCGKHCRLHLIDIVGQKFNHLTVLKEVEREVDDKKHRLFLCKCDCGEERVKRYNKLVGNYTQCCDLNCYYHKGEHSVHWKPNITI